MIMDLTVLLSEALLGSEKTIATLDGEITLKIPAGTKHATILRVKSRGVPMGNRRGDLYVRVLVQIPEKLSKEARKAVEELKKLGL